MLRACSGVRTKRQTSARNARIWQSVLREAASPSGTLQCPCEGAQQREHSAEHNIEGNVGRRKGAPGCAWLAPGEAPSRGPHLE